MLKGRATSKPNAASLLMGSAVDPTIPCDLLHLSFRIAETLPIGNDQEHKSLLHAKDN